MRTSNFLIATQKETPADAEVISHQLMLRAGLIRKLAAGLYTWLPLGLRVLRKVENIVREEMDRAGAQEVSMPVVQPAELWQESGRWEQYGPELLRIQDRHQRDFCLGPTHEEVITELVRHEIKSYKQLPINLYQIQTKVRDEIRPRFGIMRSREFLMKDAYSFHVDQPSLEDTYQRMHEAYSTIFSRLGLEFRPVIADTGSIGGNASHEFHVLADSGEDSIAFSDTSDYAANVEMAEAVAPSGERSAPGSELQEVATPGVKTIEDVANFLGIESATVRDTNEFHVGELDPRALIAVVQQHVQARIPQFFIELLGAGSHGFRLLHVEGNDSQVEGRHAVRPDDALLVVILFDGCGDYAAYANTVTAHGDGDVFAVFIQHFGLHGLAVLGAKLENVTDLDTALDAQLALAIGGGVSLGHLT